MEIIELESLVAVALTKRRSITFREIRELKRKIENKNKDVVIEGASRDVLPQMLRAYAHFFERDYTPGAEGIYAIEERLRSLDKLAFKGLFFLNTPQKVVKAVYDAVERLPK